MMTPDIESLRISCGLGGGEDLNAIARHSDAVLGAILEVADGLNLKVLNCYLDYRLGQFEVVALFGEADRRPFTALLKKVEQRMASARGRG